MKNETMKKDTEMKVVMRKTYVQVTADFYPDGRLRPSEIIWMDGKRFLIDEIREIRRMDSQRVNGSGICYFCKVWGREIRLFYEENYKWFVEERILVLGGK